MLVKLYTPEEQMNAQKGDQGIEKSISNSSGL